MNEYRDIIENIYNKQRALLQCFGLWDLRPDTLRSLKMIYKIYGYILTFGMLLFDWAMFMQVVTNLDNIDEAIKVFFVFGTALAVYGKYDRIKTKNQLFEQLFQLLIDVHFQPANNYERKIVLKSIKLSTKLSKFYACLSVTALSGLIMTQYLSAIKELPVNIYIPFEVDTNWKYNSLYVFECIFLSLLCLVNVAFDSLSTSLFIHIKCQLDMLGHRLENIGCNSKLSQQFIMQQLKDCARYYNRLIMLTNNIEDLVSIPISLQIGCSVLVLIANFYAMSMLSDPEELPIFLKIALYQCCMLTQIFMMCYFSNEVSLKSSELSFNLYMSDWYNWNKINRKMVLLLMIRFEEPIRIKSINRSYSFNLAAFTSIVNSSYSYYALLKRVNALKTFYIYQSWIFRLLALWKLSDNVTPRFRLLHNLYFYYILFFWVLSFDASCFIQFITNITDLNEVIKVFFIFATSLAVLSKFSTIKWKNHLYYELVETIHRPMFRPRNKREVKMFKESQQLSRAVRNSYCSISLCALQVVLVTQYFVDNTELPLSLYNPINVDTKLRYLMMYLYQYIAVSICCYMNIAFDSLSASFLIHIKGQLDILCDRLENLGSEDEHKIVDDNNITMKLKDCIKYYEEIVRITGIVENLISLPISIQIACSVLVLVANFYAMSFLSDPGDYANFIKFLIYQLCMLSQIYILCYFSSEVTFKSQEISYFLYCSKWVEWNKLNRKLTLLMMTRFDLPIVIRSIVNSSYSYFALLKRINS
ncbi:isoform A, Odorant receptor 46a [Lucilia cuprina]|nr:isoform A, Odorant receptor 46a [Lucilia cuprina]